MRAALCGLALLGAFAWAGAAAAQTGGGYDLRWNTVDGGGATFSSGGGYTLGATIGQPDAGNHAGGAVTLSGGFWYGPSATFTVAKDFSDNNPASVMVSLSCSAGVVSPASAPASETLPASFTVSGFLGTPACTATEVVPVNYTANLAGCTAVPLSAGGCVIVNTLNLADLSTTLVDTPDPVTAGTNLSYLATVTNNGPQAALDLAISLPLPAGTSFVSVNASPGASCNATSPVVCTWAGATASGAQRSMTVLAAVAPSTSGTLNATATASSTTSDPVPANNAGSASTTVTASADLAITLLDSPDPVTAGTPLAYTLSASNAGPSDAQDLTITLPLPAGTSFGSVLPSAGGSCNATSPVICTWSGATAPGTPRSAAVVANVSPAQLAALSATATVASPTSDPAAANNSATASTTVATSADLSIALVDAPDPVLAGGTLVYTATLANAGPSDAQAVGIALPMPAGTQFVSTLASPGGSCTSPAPGANGTISCSWAGATPPGTPRSVVVSVGVPASTPDGSVLGATATASSTTSDPVPANNSATASTGVIARADLALVLSDSPDPVVAGSALTYTANISNAGPSDAGGVTLTVNLPAGTSLQSASIPGGSCAGSPVVCSLASALPAGASRTATIQVLVAPSVPAGTLLVANGSVSSAATDPAPGNNSASTSTSVIASADLQVALTSALSQVIANVPIEITATSTNLGPSDAQDVSISLILNPDFRYISHVATGAGACTVPQVGNVGTVSCQWPGASAPGVVRTLTVSAYSNAEGSTTLSATTTSPTPDPAPTNNSASFSILVGFLVEEIPALGLPGLALLALLTGLAGIARRRS